MKKAYVSPEWEVISFSADSTMMTVDSGCPENCSEDCSICYYLVCQPQDVIIG